MMGHVANFGRGRGLLNCRGRHGLESSPVGRRDLGGRVNGLCQRPSAIPEALKGLRIAKPGKGSEERNRVPSIDGGRDISRQLWGSPVAEQADDDSAASQRLKRSTGGAERVWV